MINSLLAIYGKSVLTSILSNLVPQTQILSLNGYHRFLQVWLRNCENQNRKTCFSEFAGVKISIWRAIVEFFSTEKLFRTWKRSMPPFWMRNRCSICVFQHKIECFCPIARRFPKRSNCACVMLWFVTQQLESSHSTLNHVKRPKNEEKKSLTQKKKKISKMRHTILKLWLRKMALKNVRFLPVQLP